MDNSKVRVAKFLDVVPAHLTNMDTRRVSPTLRRALVQRGLVALPNGGRVRFAVWLKPGERAAIIEIVKASGLTRADWLLSLIDIDKEL